MLDKQQQAAIGFAYIIENLQTCSPFGEELARHTHAYPCEENARLCRELENVRLLAETIRSDAAREELSAAERALMQLKDVRRSVARSREMTLTDVEFFEIKRFLIKLDALAEAFSKIPCGERLNEIDIHPLPRALSIVDPDGMRAMTFRVSDSASAELAKIRRERKRVDAELRRDPVEGRDALEAERTLLAAREESEELRIRTEMTRAFAAHSHEAEQVIKSIARFDFALAKARLMCSRGGSIPKVYANGQRVLLNEMINPQTADALHSSGRKFTPVSIELLSGSTVITGANMGGKSVAVKTLALNAFALSAGILPFAKKLCGFPVFCGEAELPHFAGIHLLCEDMEDSLGGLSSFGGEMIHFDGILSEIKTESTALVLLDEFARGTNPHEGAALVRAAVKYFNNRRGCFALITTHFDDVACCAPMHYQVIGLKNVEPAVLDAALAGNDASRASVLPKLMDYGLYRVASDVNPPRDALAICRAMRVSDEFMRCVNAEETKQ